MDLRNLACQKHKHSTMVDCKLTTYISKGTYGVVYKINSNEVVKITDKYVYLINCEVPLYHERSSIIECVFYNTFKHENIMKISQNTTFDNDFFYLSQKFEECSLTTWTQNTSYINRCKEIPYILHQLIKALSYLEINNIVHGDLKPCNIMINPKKLRIRIIDFGACILDHRFYKKYNRHESISCTENFAAPEIQHSLKIYNIDSKNDIYSLGLIMQYIIYKENVRIESIVDSYKNNDEYFDIIDDSLFDCNKFKCIKMIKLFLKNNFNTRITATQCLFDLYNETIELKNNNDIEICNLYFPIKLRKTVIEWISELCKNMFINDCLVATCCLLDKYMLHIDSIVKNILEYKQIALVELYFTSIIRGYSIEFSQLQFESKNIISIDDFKFLCDIMLTNMQFKLYCKTNDCCINIFDDSTYLNITNHIKRIEMVGICDTIIFTL